MRLYGLKEFAEAVGELSKKVHAFLGEEKRFLLIVEHAEGARVSTGNGDLDWQRLALESRLEGVKSMINKGYTTEAEAYRDGSG
jgi:hypothetical protein